MSMSDKYLKKRAVKRHSQLLSISDLDFKIRDFAKYFFAFAFCFYISIPLFYYHVNLNWTAIDSFYVSAFAINLNGNKLFKYNEFVVCHCHVFVCGIR